MTGNVFSLAIIGIGPQGQYALECFVKALADADEGSRVSIVLFEESDQLGNGPVWSLDQTAHNWSNVTERVLELPSRGEINLGQSAIPGFPSYHEWRGLEFDIWPADRIDTYPPRRDIGRYLSERCQTLLQPLVRTEIVTLVGKRVEELSVVDNVARMVADDGSVYFADQALVTIGHQPVKPDQQLASWCDRARTSPTLTVYEDPYPVEKILQDIEGKPSVEMALRGFGLATIDVVRAIAERYGTFTPKSDGCGHQYHQHKKNVDVQLVPFSLDGLPLGPKPLTPALDALFEPSAETLATLRTSLGDPARQQAAVDENFLLDDMVPVIASVFRSLENKCRSADETDIEELIHCWVRDQRFSHGCFSKADQPVRDLMSDLVEMAVGKAPVSLDYCIGQVWRQCHPTIYAALSHSRLSKEAFAKIIALDESLKRYSFGPPVESIQQLIILVDTGMLDLRFLHDPDIQVSKEGWTFSNGDEEFATRTIVNAVLDEPDLEAICSPLIASLFAEGIFNQAYDDLGVLTDVDGFVEPGIGRHIPVAVLGRLAKGSVIGVDAILECFGDRPERWAKAAAARLKLT